MAKWTVIALGMTTGAEYVYKVSGPDDARDSEVTEEAFRQHGMLFAHRTVTETLDIRTVTVRKN